MDLIANSCSSKDAGGQCSHLERVNDSDEEGTDEDIVVKRSIRK